MFNQATFWQALTLLLALLDAHDAFVMRSRSSNAPLIRTFFNATDLSKRAKMSAHSSQKLLTQLKNAGLVCGKGGRGGGYRFCTDKADPGEMSIAKIARAATGNRSDEQKEPRQRLADQIVLTALAKMTLREAKDMRDRLGL